MTEPLPPAQAVPLDPMPDGAPGSPPSNATGGNRAPTILAGCLTALAGILLFVVGDRAVQKVYLGDQLVANRGLRQDGVVVFFALAVIAAGALGAFLGRSPAIRSVVTVVTTAAAAFLALILLGIRTDDDLGTTVQNKLGPGGWLIAIGFMLLVVAVVVFLISPKDFVGGNFGGGALASGIMGLLVVPFAPLAILLGKARQATGGRSGLGTAGMIIGIVGFVLWIAGLGIAAMFAQP